MNTEDVIRLASAHLGELSGHTFDLLTLSKPISSNAALNLAKIISKLSPLVGNLIEFNTVEILNDKKDFKIHGRWIRQDPGFPDTIFLSGIVPTPGFEIKTWFPLATEITAHFKDSQTHFAKDQTYVALLAWLPENLIFGRPKIIDVCIISGRSVAVARDTHYHNPPVYLVLEPEDTTDRTKNLKQTNTNGFRFQGTDEQLEAARKIVGGWGPKGKKYKPTRRYQDQLRKLIARFPYRLDTNFAKMDRIVHSEIEEIKTRVYETMVHGMTVAEWNKLLAKGDDISIQAALQTHFDIRKEDSGEIHR